MIQLRSDCLVFTTSAGHSIPCSVEEITVEMMGEAAEWLDADMIHHAAVSVLHYFRNELERNTISVGEFCLALEQVLRSFGLNVRSTTMAEPADRVAESDLRLLASESGKGFELIFFPRLREEMRKKLVESPHGVRFKGLRGCVKQLAGARRWSARCQKLNDHIVEFLRGCQRTEAKGATCSLIVL